MSRFLSTVYNIRVRVVSDIQTLAFGSSLYIRYNTAAHVVTTVHIVQLKIVTVKRWTDVFVLRFNRMYFELKDISCYTNLNKSRYF